MVKIQKSNLQNEYRKKLAEEFSLSEEQANKFLSLKNNNYEDARSYIKDYLRKEQKNSANTEQLKPTKKIYRYLNGLLIDEKFYDYNKYEELRDLSNNHIDKSIFNIQEDHIDVEIIEMQRIFKIEIPSEIIYKSDDCKIYFKFENQLILLKTNKNISVEEINIYLNEKLGTNNKKLRSKNIEQIKVVGEVNKNNLIFE